MVVGVRPLAPEFVTEGESDAQEEPWLLTADQVARRLGVSRSKVYELLQGDLPSIKIGNCRRILASSLRAWLKKHETVF